MELFNFDLTPPGGDVRRVVVSADEATIGFWNVTDAEKPELKEFF